MDRNAIIAAFSIPALMFLHAILRLAFSAPADGWSDIIYGIELAVAVFAAVLVGITVVVLRKRELQWWYALLLSIGSIVVVFGIIVLLARSGV